ncbi:hypothetical protein GM415_04235 [Pseudodesulfovibrio cashew]|uniref:Uncharacterized protein n=1 Tax=Pseudodesulfovibrio cashew TaxID=2678688 RepID=A0A6I6JE62_9BACT|nr:hypothetical protein [Pseudodesulfovibrio cashew]QGY39360.1 hypothetical protein GM415_04235 [Pseudodesulfovibrio cashew]
MTDSLRMELCRFNGLLEPLQPRQTILGIKPMTAFVAGNNLYVSDQLSNSMRKYCLGGEPQLAATSKFNGDGANWFANYDATSERIWMIGKDSNRLISFDAALNRVNEMTVPSNAGFFFSHGGEHYLMSGFAGPRRLYKVKGDALAELDAKIPGSLGGDFLLGHHVGDEIFFAYFDSRVVFRFSGGKFIRIAQLNDLPGRIYSIRHLADYRLYVILTSKGKRACLHFYTEKFRPVQAVVLEKSIAPGTLACNGNDVYIGSYYTGRIDKYRLPMQAYAEIAQ